MRQATCSPDVSNRVAGNFSKCTKFLCTVVDHFLGMKVVWVCKPIRAVNQLSLECHL